MLELSGRQTPWSIEEGVYSARKRVPCSPQVPPHRSALSLTPVAHAVLGAAAEAGRGKAVTPPFHRRAHQGSVQEGSQLCAGMGAQTPGSQGRLLPRTPGATRCLPTQAASPRHRLHLARPRLLCVDKLPTTQGHSLPSDSCRQSPLWAPQTLKQVCL